MTEREICNEREFYDAVREYTNKIWRWGAHLDDDDCDQPSPDELIGLLEARIAWVKAHKKAVDQYLKRRNGPTWVRVYEGSKSDSTA